MKDNIKKSLVAVVAVGAMALGGSALASAASENGSTGSTGAATKPPAGAPTGRTGTPPDMASKTAINPNEKLLTGSVATKVKAAATAKVKGTVDRVETDDGGVYEAHVTKSDGTHVEVKVNKSYKVTSVNEMGAGGPGGGPDGGQRGGPGAAPSGAPADSGQGAY